jgi:tetratricopeptide (TPR) repeat protein
MVEQRQLAERARIAGNAAMAAGQWAEALRCYESGLEAQRHNMALHANAALAALKKSCFVQALEHCDKVGTAMGWQGLLLVGCPHLPGVHMLASRSVISSAQCALAHMQSCATPAHLKVLHIADALHGRPRDPLCVKALMRRAAALQGLDQHGRAVADLERALQLCGGRDGEVVDQLRRARVLAEERARHKQAEKAVRRTRLPAIGRPTCDVHEHGWLQGCR